MPTEDEYKKLEEELKKSKKFKELRKDLKNVKRIVDKNTILAHQNDDYKHRSASLASAATRYAQKEMFHEASSQYESLFKELCKTDSNEIYTGGLSKEDEKEILKLLKHVEKDAFNYAKRAKEGGQYDDAASLLKYAKRAREILDSYEKK